jgi:hypothetical protein
VSKVEIAKQAIAKAASVLNSTDRVGVVGFDDTAKWLVNMQPMANLGNGVLEDTLKPVAAEGNTNLHAGLQEAVTELEKTDARLKHIILVSDGWTRQGDFTSILNEMDAQNITLSSVGAGQGAADVLRLLAEKGGGRYYAAEDVTSIPDVFLKETVRLVGSYYVEQPFKPQLARASPILNGLDPGSLPSLLGYNGSTIKPNAELVLKSPAGDPILAQWQYGLGRSVAWTPDLKGRWAMDWVKWAQFSRFAGQLVGWVLQTQQSPGIESVFSQSPGLATAGQDVGVRVNSVDATGAPRNFLLTTVAVSSTTGLSTTVSALQQSPGVYGGTVKDLKQGVYEARIEQRDLTTGSVVANQSTGFVVPYASEYVVSPDDARASADLVADLVQLGNGRRLDVASPAAAVAHDVASQPRPVALWPWLVALAALLFPLDVAVRRLSISFNVRRLFRRGAGESR